MNKITAIVPVREHISGILPHKDNLPFAGTNLLTHKIRQLKQVKPFINIVVSTESERLAEIAKKEDVSVLMRPKKYAERDVPFCDFVKYLCENIDSTHILWACVTSPLVESKLYTKAIKIYFEKLDDGFDSLVSVQRLQRYLMDANGAYNFHTGKKFKPQNELPLLYIYTNGISIAPREKMIEWGYTSGDIPYMLELDKRASIDICDNFDYECAKKFLNYNLIEKIKE